MAYIKGNIVYPGPSTKEYIKIRDEFKQVFLKVNEDVLNETLDARKKHYEYRNAEDCAKALGFVGFLLFFATLFITFFFIKIKGLESWPAMSKILLMALTAFLAGCIVLGFICDQKGSHYFEIADAIYSKKEEMAAHGMFNLSYISLPYYEDLSGLDSFKITFESDERYLPYRKILDKIEEGEYTLKNPRYDADEALIRFDIYNKYDYPVEDAKCCAIRCESIKDYDQCTAKSETWDFSYLEKYSDINIMIQSCEIFQKVRKGMFLEKIRREIENEK